jgi:hypothetical protein
MPVGEVGLNGEAQQAEQPLTYPEIVSELREYLGMLVSWGSTDPGVIVAIDELDKIDGAEQAQVFINEIKGVFGVDGTQFLVSVSAEAVASFERRGLPVRDAFDSTFDEIVRIEAMNLLEACTLLRKRVIGLPDLFCALAHCMSGGLPRDLIRTARLMCSVAGTERIGIDQVCAGLVGADLARKVHAFQVATGTLSGMPDSTTFIRGLRGLRAEPTTLLTALPALLPEGGEHADPELTPLRWQAATYVYHCTTLLEVFTDGLTDDRFNRRRSAIDELARAKQSLSTHPQVAWLMLDDFRAAWGLTVPT